MRKTLILHDSIIGHFEYLKDSIIGRILILLQEIKNDY
nr:MAG TPA: hypothetical protein [Caudoviricetes sp.]